MMTPLAEPTLSIVRFITVKDIEYNIRIAKVRELTATNSISRWELIKCADNDIGVTLKSRLIPLPENSRLSMVIGTDYYIIRNLLRHNILHYNIEVTFDINPFPASTHDPTAQPIIPPRLLTLMYSTAIGALRGMLALRVENTCLKNYPLPLINISALVSEMLYGSKLHSGTIPLVEWIYN